jgi:hypothetical protein
VTDGWGDKEGLALGDIEGGDEMVGVWDIIEGTSVKLIVGCCEGGSLFG